MSLAVLVGKTRLIHFFSGARYEHLVIAGIACGFIAPMTYAPLKAKQIKPQAPDQHTPPQEYMIEKEFRTLMNVAILAVMTAGITTLASNYKMPLEFSDAAKISALISTAIGIRRFVSNHLLERYLVAVINGRKLFASESYEQALPLFKRALQLEPLTQFHEDSEVAATYVTVGIYLYLTRQPVQALNFFNRALFFLKILIQKMIE